MVNGIEKKQKKDLKNILIKIKKMSIISINGNTYIGNSVAISNGKVFIDGKEASCDGKDSKEINITVNGNIDELKVDACNKVLVTGDVFNIHTQSGDVDVSGNVKGGIQTMSGDVDCGDIGGSISTMSGDIKHRKH